MCHQTLILFFIDLFLLYPEFVGISNLIPTGSLASFTLLLNIADKLPIQDVVWAEANRLAAVSAHRPLFLGLCSVRLALDRLPEVLRCSNRVSVL